MRSAGSRSVATMALVLGAAGLLQTVATAAETPSSAMPALKLSAVQMQAAGVKVQTARPAQSLAQAAQAGRGMRLAGRVVSPGDTSGILLSTVSGQLESVFVQPGSKVRAGQPLARIHSAQLAAMQREYLQAHSAAELSASQLARDEALFEEGIIAESRLRETRAARQLALAAEQEHRRLLILAGYTDSAIAGIAPGTLSSTVTLQAAGDAVVLAQSSTIGQQVEPGTELFRLASSGRRWLELNAAPAEAEVLRIGDRVSIVGCGNHGRVIAVGSQLDTASQTLLVRVEMSDSAALCPRPNQYIEADVQPATAPAGLTSVPASALLRNADRDYVFVQRGAAFTPVPVTVERRYGEELWLLAGIAPGTRVVSAGITALKGAWLGLGPALAGSATP